MRERKKKNEGEKRISGCRRMPSNLCRYSILKKVEHNFPLIKCGLHSDFQRVQHKKSVTNHVDNMYP